MRFGYVLLLLFSIGTVGCGTDSSDKSLPTENPGVDPGNDAAPAGADPDN